MNEQATDAPSAQFDDDSEWLRHFLIEHAGNDVDFDALLGRGCRLGQSGSARDVFEKDRVRLLKEIVGYLSSELGAELAAANWLFHNPVFQAAVGYDPYDYLKDGDFDAIALLHALLKIRAEGRHAGASLDTALLPLQRSQ